MRRLLFKNAARPSAPALAEKHGFANILRHGTLSLDAALNPQTGGVIGQTAARPTSQESVRVSGGSRHHVTR